MTIKKLVGHRRSLFSNPPASLLPTGYILANPGTRKINGKSNYLYYQYVCINVYRKCDPIAYRSLSVQVSRRNGYLYIFFRLGKTYERTSSYNGRQASKWMWGKTYQVQAPSFGIVIHLLKKKQVDS